MKSADVSYDVPTSLVGEREGWTHLAGQVDLLLVAICGLAPVPGRNHALILLLVGRVSARLGNGACGLLRLLLLRLHEAEDRVAELVRDLAAEVEVRYCLPVMSATTSQPSSLSVTPVR